MLEPGGGGTNGRFSDSRYLPKRVRLAQYSAWLRISAATGFAGGGLLVMMPC
jgi:hypothetical protein